MQARERTAGDSFVSAPRRRLSGYWAAAAAAAIAAAVVAFSLCRLISSRPTAHTYIDIQVYVYVHRRELKMNRLVKREKGRHSVYVCVYGHVH